MSIGVTDIIAPLGSFPVAEDTNVKGGYQTSASTVDRDVIPAANRKVGMQVYTVATSQTWILGPGITNGDWTLVPALSYGGAPANVTKAAADAGVASTVSRSDHKHDAATAAPSIGIGAANSEGSATSFARSDHGHALRTTTGPTDLAIGAIVDGELLKRVGGAIVSVPAGGGGGGGNIVTRVTVTNAMSPYTVLAADHLIMVNTTAGAVTLTLPAHGTTDREYIVKDIAGTFGTNACTLARNGGTGTIEGLSASYLLEAPYQSQRIASDAVSAWWLL